MSEDAEGVVTFSYRTQPEGPPDVQQIQKQMAIVAWQPGLNRYVHVPSQVSFMAFFAVCSHYYNLLRQTSNFCPMF